MPIFLLQHVSNALIQMMDLAVLISGKLVFKEKYFTIRGCTFSGSFVLCRYSFLTVNKLWPVYALFLLDGFIFI